MNRNVTLSGLAFLAGLSLIIFTSQAWALWPFSGVPVSTETAFVAGSGPGPGKPPSVLGIGGGGVAVYWTGRPLGSTTSDIFMRIVDPPGVVTGPGPIPICTAVNSQNLGAVVEDHAGGAILIWDDGRIAGDIDIYAQRVDASGAVSWTTEGVLVSAVSDAVPDLVAAPDLAGGAIMAWLAGGTSADVYAQRVDASGATLWPAPGVVVAGAMGRMADPRIATDGSGGAYVVWGDRRGALTTYAQRLDASGAPVWIVNGIPLGTASTIGGGPMMTRDGAGGLFVIWSRAVSGVRRIYAQRLDGAGNALWDPNGVLVNPTDGVEVQQYEIVPGGPIGGAIVKWRQSSSGRYRVEILDAAGNLTSPGGAGFTVFNDLGTGSSSLGSTLVEDGSRGAVIAWVDGLSNISGQRVDATGNTLWATNGVPLVVGPGYGRGPVRAVPGESNIILSYAAQSFVNAGTTDPSVSIVDLASPTQVHIVTNTNDAGAGSLRDAITTANSSPGSHHAIAFELGGVGPHTIQPATPLPALAVSTLVEGRTPAGGFSVNLDGSLAGGWGLEVTAPDCAIRRLAIHGFGAGGVGFGPTAGGSSIEACHVGTDVAGVSAFPNNGDGIAIFDVSKTVYVNGVRIVANVGAGLRASNASGVVVANSDIGVGVGGIPLGNAEYGIRLEGSTSFAQIGPGFRWPLLDDDLDYTLSNTIAHNGGHGISVAEAVGPAVHLNFNLIHSNGGLGIDTAEEGPNSGTPATSYMPAPVLTSAILGSGDYVDVWGTASGPSLAQVQVQVFASDGCDASGFGEGARLLGAIPLTLDGAGNANFAASLLNDPPPDTGDEDPVHLGDVLTAVLVIPGRPTSEYSNCRPVNNTGTGTGVVVTYDDPGSGTYFTVTFGEVTVEGATTFASGATGPPVTSGFLIGEPPLYLDISSTAGFTNATVCLQYDELAIGIPEEDLVLLHYDGILAEWVDVTSSVDVDANLICGNVTSLSPFIIARQPTTDTDGAPALPKRVAFGSARPNPAHGLARFTLELPERTEVEIRIFDAAGRTVRTMAGGEAWEAGVHTLEWAGNDDQGRPAAPGVYFASGRAGGVEIRQRVVFMR